MVQFRELTDHYRLEKILGSSRSATVLRGTELKTDRTVAIKLINVGDPSGLTRGAARFSRLTEILLALKHPNLPQLIDSGFTTEGGAFVVTELLSGIRFEELTGAPYDRTLPLLIGAVEVVAALAEVGEAHGNLGPDNLFVTAGPGYEAVKLLGLGSAIFRPVGVAADAAGSKDEAARYRAPEVVAGGPASPAADVYSLARTVCHALGATVASDDASGPAVQMPLSLSFDLSNAEVLRTVLEKSLREDPAARPSPSELRSAIRLAMGATEPAFFADGLGEDTAISSAPAAPAALAVAAGVPEPVLPGLADLDLTSLDLSVAIPPPAPFPPAVRPVAEAAAATAVPAPSWPQTPPSPTPPFSFDDGIDFGDLGPGAAPFLGFGPAPRPTFGFEDLTSAPPEPPAEDSASSAAEMAGAASAVSAAGVADMAGFGAAAALPPLPPPPAFGAFEPDPHELPPGLPVPPPPPAVPEPPPASPVSAPRATPPPFPAASVPAAAAPPTPAPAPALPVKPIEEGDVLSIDDELLAVLDTPVPAASPAPPSGRRKAAPPPRPAAAGPANTAGTTAASAGPVAPAGPPRRLLGLPRMVALGGIAALVLLAFALVAWWLIGRAVVPTKTAEAAEAPAPRPMAAPPVVVPPIEKLNEAARLASAGESYKAWSVIQSISPAERGVLPPASGQMLASIEASLTQSTAQHLPDDLLQGLEKGDPAELRGMAAAAAALSGTPLPPVAAEALGKVKSAVALYDEALAASGQGKSEEVLERFAAAKALVPNLADPDGARDRAAMAVAEQAAASARAGKYDEALAHLAPIERAWPDRQGFAELKGRYEAAKRMGQEQEALLANLPNFERRRKPDEGLLALRDVKPVPHLEARFAEERARLERQLFQLDGRPPQVVLRDGYSLLYSRGTVANLSFRATDDYQVVSVRLLAAPEGGKMRNVPLEKGRNGSWYSTAIRPDFHKNGTVRFYVVATDISGHEGSLGSAGQPLELKRAGSGAFR
jgi:serine/threonine protein kinase/tetratricopeptide (TPR) repeat protein